MSLDLRHVRPGEVITDCYGNVWGKFEDGRIVPLMLAGGHPMISGPIQRMLMDHHDLELQLAEMIHLTQAFQAPVDACSKWRHLYKACAKLHADLSLHMKIENELLFPRFAQERAA